MKVLLAILLCLSSSAPAFTGEIESYRRSTTSTKTCSRRQYREEYIPGTPESPGYVKNWYEYVEVPCDPNKKAQSDKDTNDCTEGSVIGGILGAGIAASGSRGKGRCSQIQQSDQLLY